MEEELLLVDVHTGKPRSVAGERQVSQAGSASGADAR